MNMGESPSVTSGKVGPLKVGRPVEALFDELRSIHQKHGDDLKGWPAYVRSLSTADEIRTCEYALFDDTDGKTAVQINDEPEEGPWEIDAVIRGGEGTNYDRDFRIVLTFPGDWPKRPARVRIKGILHHILLMDGNEPMPVFYHPQGTYAPSNTEGTYDIMTCLKAVHGFLSAPLKWPEGSMSPLQEREIARQWEEAAASDAERHEIISKYRNDVGAKHNALFEAADSKVLPRAWFDAEFARVVLDGEGDADAIRAMVKEECTGAYSFPFVTKEFSDMVIEEAEHYQQSGLPVRRPNSMNAYGLILNEIGLEGLMDALQQQAFLPVSRALFPAEVACRFDAHHSFLVHYEIGHDLGLDMHTDDSDITFNTCLGKEFEGAGLTICGVMGEEGMRKLRHVYSHVVGRCLVHLGRHRHGADDITKGERLNLICWNHNYLWRKSSPYKTLTLPDETEPPDAQCLSFTHDRDHPNAKPSAWYPPKRSEVRFDKRV